MNFCGTHNTELQKAITVRGMWAMVATDVQTIKRRAQAWLHGTASAADFDPLVIATLELLARTREHAGFCPNNKCALCFAEHKLGKGIDHSWIEKCTDAIKEASQASSLTVFRANRKVNGTKSPIITG